MKITLPTEVLNSTFSAWKHVLSNAQHLHGTSIAKKISARQFQSAADIVFDDTLDHSVVAQSLLDNHEDFCVSLLVFGMFSYTRPPRGSIVMEGVDGSGKSTAAIDASLSLGLPIVHFGKLDGEDLKFAPFIYSSFHEIPGLIMDRSFISSVVYHGYDEISRYVENTLINSIKLSGTTVEMYGMPPRDIFTTRRPNEDYDSCCALNAKYIKYAAKLVESGINVRKRVSW